MELSRAALSAYDASLARQERAAERYVRERLERLMAARPDDSVAEVRDFAIEVCEAAAELYGDAAAAVAADLYDELAEAAGERVGPASAGAPDVGGHVDKEVRYQAGKLADGAPSAFVAQVAQFAADQVARRANQTMRENAARDGVRYARVPMGGETCTFCAMLASRGFAYRSKATAGEGNHYHRGCRCKVVPGFGGLSVQGYDPDEWLGRWKAMEGIDNDGRVPHRDKAELKANISRASGGSLTVSRSVGAKAPRDYVVAMPGGTDSYFYPGSEIDEKAVFAGKGTKTVLRVAERLADAYGGEASDWYHASGEGWIFDPVDNGRIKKAEVHWMANDDIGLFEFYFKRWVGRYRDT